MHLTISTYIISRFAGIQKETQLGSTVELLLARRTSYRNYYPSTTEETVFQLKLAPYSGYRVKSCSYAVRDIRLLPWIVLKVTG